MHVIQITGGELFITFTIIMSAFVVVILGFKAEKVKSNQLDAECEKLTAEGKALRTTKDRLIQENKDLVGRFCVPPTRRRFTVSFTDPTIEPLVIEAYWIRFEVGVTILYDANRIALAAVKTEMILSVTIDILDPPVNLRSKIKERIAELRQAGPSGVKVVDEYHPYVLAELTRLLESLEK